MAGARICLITILSTHRKQKEGRGQQKRQSPIPVTGLLRQSFTVPPPEGSLTSPPTADKMFKSMDPWGHLSFKSPQMRKLRHDLTGQWVSLAILPTFRLCPHRRTSAWCLLQKGNAWLLSVDKIHPSYKHGTVHPERKRAVEGSNNTGQLERDCQS